MDEPRHGEGQGPGGPQEADREADREADPALRERPSPAHPQRRREPLPWQRPKPAEEDPEAPRRVQAILASPTYRQADQDVDFLARDETRGVRLQLDYLKPELLMQEHGIQHTIVVFGSTRIPEPATALRRLEEARAEAAAHPRSRAAAHRVAVAERILAKSVYYDVAREFGRLVGEAGEGPGDSRLVVMTGGGPGMMEAANRGAYDAGAKTVGLNITLPHEQFPNPYLTPELCFRFHYFALRKLHFLKRAKALVAFPGGYGTLDELFETLTLVQTRKIRPVPVVLVGEAFWRRAVDFDFLVEEGVIDPEDRELFWFAETAREIWEGIQDWYRAAGEPLL
ncbi:MAG: TIGR00730 family Rossman fold protein [Gammaproteobacteria bacterium]|nr:MAG: TIGR00730 family Rossman fold protein [Gammaproteobacteria bacterium]